MDNTHLLNILSKAEEIIMKAQQIPDVPGRLGEVIFAAEKIKRFCKDALAERAAGKEDK